MFFGCSPSHMRWVRSVRPHLFVKCWNAFVSVDRPSSLYRTPFECAVPPPAVPCSCCSAMPTWGSTKGCDADPRILRIRRHHLTTVTLSFQLSKKYTFQEFTVLISSFASVAEWRSSTYGPWSRRISLFRDTYFFFICDFRRTCVRSFAGRPHVCLFWDSLLVFFHEKRSIDKVYIRKTPAEYERCLVGNGMRSDIYAFLPPGSKQDRKGLYSENVFIKVQR